MWEDLFRDMFGGVGSMPSGLPGDMSGAGGMPLPTTAAQPALPSANAPNAQPGVTPQPGGLAPSQAPAPQAPAQPLQPQPTQGVGGQAAGVANSSRGTLSPEMQRALAMMMSPGTDQMRPPGAPAAFRPQVQPFLPGGQVMPNGPRFGARRGL